MQAVCNIPGQTGGAVVQTSSQSRDIKETYGFSWQENEAVFLIVQHYANHRRTVAMALYLALTSVASQQRTPGQATATCSYIGERAGLSEQTARRYLHEFAEIGLVAITTGRNSASTYDLLAVRRSAVATGNLDAPTMPLNDRTGLSRQPLPRGSQPTRLSAKQSTNPMPRGITGDTPHLPAVNPQPVTADTLNAGQGITAEPQYNKLETKKEQNNNRAAAARGVDPAGQEASQRLRRLGTTRSQAEAAVASYGAEAVAAWCAYAEANKSLYNPAGFVTARLQAGDPVPASRSGSIITAEEVAELRTRYQAVMGEAEPLPEPDYVAEPLPVSTTPPPPPAALPPVDLERARRVWFYDVRDDLRHLVGQAVWLAGFHRSRVVRTNGTEWIVALPTAQLAVANVCQPAFERLLAERVGHPVHLCWQTDRE